jgi:hypothetical protein
VKVLDFCAFGRNLGVVTAGLVVVVDLEAVELLLFQVVFATEPVQLFLIIADS